jgi:hypothetical protein
MRIIPLFVLLAMLPAGGQRTNVFDYDHVRLAIRYLENPTPENLEALAETEASLHLKRHSDHTGYYSPDATPLDIARDLVSDPDARDQVEAVRDLLRQVIWLSSREKQMCLSEVVKYGPPGARVEGKLFFTWGYDIGVAVGRSASINLAHPEFLQDPSETWYYCIHELHHTLVMKEHPLPRLADIEFTDELFDLIQYLTFLEGTAVYAAYDARARNGALGADPDYVAIEDPDAMLEYERAYFRLYREVEALDRRRLTDEDWALLDQLSGGDRLWYRVGARMAQTIDRVNGRESLQEIIREGPEAFFEGYQAVASRIQD